MVFNGQVGYALAPVIGKVGAIANSTQGIVCSARVANVAIPFGCMTVRDADDSKAKLPTSAAEVLAACKGSGGIAVATHAIVSDGTVAVPTYPIQKEFAQMKHGVIFVLIEEDVTQGDQAYVRYADAVAAQNATYLANGNANQKGAFRKSYDGTAQVATLTPTAANATIYALEIFDENGKLIAAAEFLSSGAATATNIVTGLKAALGTVAGITLSGTATLILTANTAGLPFSVRSIGDGVIANVATQANVASAAPAPGCYFKSSATAGSLAKLNVNLGGL